VSFENRGGGVKRALDQFSQLALVLTLCGGSGRSSGWPPSDKHACTTWPGSSWPPPSSGN